MTFRSSLLLFVFLGISGIATAQQNLVYNHYFLNPFLYNPSYVAPNGYTEVYLNYRKQWADFDGAPTTATFNLHLPINYKMGVGFTAYQDEAGILRTTTALLSYAYTIYLGENVNQVHKLAFGVSAGMTFSYIPLDQVENGGIPDNALSTNNTSSMDGQAGVHYQLKNLRLSFALPRLFRTYVTSQEGFNQPAIGEALSTLSSISYNIPIGTKFSFEPFVIYRTEQGFASQYEAAGVLRFNDVAWIGGSYRQDYGTAAFLGFNIKDRIKIGYAYEFAPQQSSSLGNGSHEIQLVMRLGKKRSPYSKAKPVTPVEQLAQDSVQEESLAEKKVEEPVETPAAVVVAPIIIRNDSAQQSTAQITQPKDETAKEAAEQESKKHGGESLVPGHYVVVGAFLSAVNAQHYVTTLKRVGYPAAMSYYSTKNLYIVHMGNTPTIEEARKLRDEYRARSRYSFRDTWVLTIE